MRARGNEGHGGRLPGPRHGASARLAVGGVLVKPLRVIGAASGSRVQLDGLALMLSTAATAASSLLFWVVAARSYDAASVGIASSEIAAFTMLAGFAQLNLLAVFLRFLAGSGNRAIRFLGTGYGAIAVAGLVFGGGYLALGLAHGFLGGAAAWNYLVFVLVVPVFAWFVVQDGVLTAFSKAPWVPVENLGVALVRLALIGLVLPVVLGAGQSRPGIVAAWALPTVIAVVVVNAFVFRGLAPAQVRRSPDHSALPRPREMASFVVAQYLNNTVSNVVTYVPPLLVLYLLGPADAAYFNVPWLIVISTQTLLWNLGMSFIAEVTRRPEAMAAHIRSILRLGGLVVLGWTVLLLAAGSLLLGLQGGDFADRGAGLLRLLALSFPCSAVVILYSVVASLERRIWRLVLLNAAGAAALLIAVLLGTRGTGITGVGLVYLLVQGALAVVLLPSLVVKLRSGAIRLPEYHGTGSAAPDVGVGSSSGPLATDPALALGAAPTEEQALPATVDGDA